MSEPKTTVEPDFDGETTTDFEDNLELDFDEDAVVEEPVVEEKPKRTRRTKAQIAEDEAKAAPKVSGTSVRQLRGAMGR